MRKLVCLVALCLAVSCSDDEGSGNNANNSNANNTANNASNNANNTSNNANNIANNGSNNSTNNAANNANNASNNANNTSNNANNSNCMLLDPALGVCDPICQTGCDAGQNCISKQASANEAPTASCQAAGTKTSGECAADTECAEGHVCLAVDGRASECLPYCRPGLNSGCTNGTTCRPFALDLRVGVCVLEVDECSFFPDSCGDGKNCYDTPDGTRCATYDSDAAVDKACATSNECNDSYRCVGINGGGLACKRICNPNEPACPDNTACQRMNDANGNPLAWGACL